ncbi:ESCRT-0 subunit protein hse1 [Recurvomyces mirabilis]|uniref:ESCRT-0 subunit protein hse1 n=1 Tax=Recurvomyces mirabilis TaxID=574656 RepID=UPI002DDDD474|nr:ESCRT-0 subunit protein hse1 [Recurvomyces mirabilis]
MFRAASNPMDDAIVKATDENLTSENWEYILDVCDRVSTTPAGPQHAISALIKRLAHRNANVQLYTLELANALSQNCGAPLHRELASKAFTDSLLRLAGDRNTHGQVKQKVVERMENWTEEFRNSPDLGIMEQAYGRLRTQQPGLQAPSKPVKQQISHEDRRKEEEELQMALALSVQDKAAAASSPPPAKNGDNQQTPQAQPAAPQGTTAATVSRVRALYDFAPSEAGELAFAKGDIIAVLESVYKDWWKGSLKGQTGIFPLNYVEKLPDPTKEELERDAQMEAEVFGEIKNVEKLLALLSVGEGRSRRGVREEEEISDLYQRTLSIRPKLIELIGKYSQKKDEFTQLNEKFIKARRDYEHLLEDSMKAPQQYQQYPVRSRQPMYPPQQQPPYGGPQQGLPQGYPPQNAPAQGYPPQAPFAAQSQQHLPPQQDPQRFYSPAPPNEAPAQHQPGYGNPYPPQDGPPTAQPISAGPAPFHFIPGGLQAPPPQQQQQQQQQQQLSPQDHTIRRKPSPQGLQPPHHLSPTNEPYSAQQQMPFQGQIRPESIHTLNSGNPQELATSGYESPVDNRHSYPPAHQMQGVMLPPPQQQQVQPYPHDPYGGQQQAPPPPHQQAPPPPLQLQQQPLHNHNDRDNLPSRQRTQSFESPTSLYSQHQHQHPSQQGDNPPYSAGGAVQSGMPPQQPSGPPPGVPSSPQFAGPPPVVVQQQQSGGYQAYQPFGAGGPPQLQGQQQQQQQYPVGGGGGGGGVGDPGDFYR